MVILGVVGLAVCALIWYQYREEWKERRLAEREWRKEAMLTEAEGVLLDFLDYGREVAQASEGRYHGTISVRMHPVHKSGEVGFCISMHDCTDLSQIAEEVLEEYHLRAFVKKYGYYFDPERNAIRYETSRGVKLQLQEKATMEKQLFRRIQNHPMAVLQSDSLINTRGI